MLILGNGKVFTRDAACPIIENGAVVIDGTTICQLGNTGYDGCAKEGSTFTADIKDAKEFT